MVDWWAELGRSHQGSVKRACDIVDAARSTGFTTIKIPYWKVDEVFRPGSIPHARRVELRSVELSADDVAVIARHAHAKGMRVAVSVCTVGRAYDVDDHTDFLKIGSYEATSGRLIREAHHLHGARLVISTGGMTPAEVKQLRRLAPGAKLLHCVSKYPCPPADVDLGRILRLQLDGYSDHTRDPETVKAAVVRYGARIVEMHVDLWERHNNAGIAAELGVTRGPARIGRKHVWWVGRRLAPSVAVVIASTEDALDPPSGPTDERQWRADPRDGMRPMREE